LITNKGESQDIQKTPKGWILNDLFYARMDTLFEWVQALKNAELIEMKTADSKHFPALQLTDDDMRVRLFSGDEVLADLILGKNTAVMSSRFVRYYDQPQSWLATNLNELKSSNSDWQLRILFDYDKSEVAVIRLSDKGDLAMHLMKNNETGEWFIENEPETLLDNDKVEQLAASLSMFSIVQAEPLSVGESSYFNQLEYGLMNGSQVLLTIYQVADKKVLTVTDTHQPNRFKDWQFSLPDYKIKALSVTKEQLLKPVEEMAVSEAAAEVVPINLTGNS